MTTVLKILRTVLFFLPIMAREVRTSTARSHHATIGHDTSSMARGGIRNPDSYYEKQCSQSVGICASNGAPDAHDICHGTSIALHHMHLGLRMPPRAIEFVSRPMVAL